MPKVIGIDPGLVGTGVGIVTGDGFRIASYSYGSIATSKRYPLPKRLARIYAKLRELLIQETPDLLVIEEVFSLQKFPKSGIALGQVSGIALLAAARADIPAREVAVREAKQVLTGNGNASKEQLELSVRNRLDHPTPIRPYHASDALGLALIGLLRYSSISRTPQPGA